jgi:hypothetical protein
MTGDPPFQTHRRPEPARATFGEASNLGSRSLLFHQALELEPAAREGLIRPIEATDPALAAEVRSSPPRLGG